MTIQTGMLGVQAEKLASKYLQRNGLRLIEKNFHCRFGEIDLIMQDKNNSSLVFVEVRYRRSSKYGGAIASVGYHKQQKLRRSAESYLIKHKVTDSACRFDILCINGNLNNPEIEWISNAF